MSYILAYTKRGEGCYDDTNYPGLIAYNCDWEHAMHLAVSKDGKAFTALRNNTGILFPKCTFTEGKPKERLKPCSPPGSSAWQTAPSAFPLCAATKMRPILFLWAA